MCYFYTFYDKKLAYPKKEFYICIVFSWVDIRLV